ncbi:hypothetical protein SMG44B_10506 [Stenotrophomonas maltophilia]
MGVRDATSCTPRAQLLSMCGSEARIAPRERPGCFVGPAVVFSIFWKFSLRMTDPERRNGACIRVGSFT